jgi:2-oxoglutarate dehydrogenase E1 component
MAKGYNFKEEFLNNYLSGSNSEYIYSLYASFLDDPHSLPEDWREFFQSLPQDSAECDQESIRELFAQKTTTSVAAIPVISDKQSAVNDYINAYRRFGHLRAKLDPLDTYLGFDNKALHHEFYGLNDADLDVKFLVPQYLAQGNNNTLTLRELDKLLANIYSKNLGIEYMHIADPKVLSWMQEKLETKRGDFNFSNSAKKTILQGLIEADIFERYLGTRFVGQKRFALEGGDALIPMMQELIKLCAQQEVKELVLGMSHRGRLNVLINVIGKKPSDLFDAFEGKHSSHASDRSGDVKYHLGFSSNLQPYENSPTVHVALAFNPSHLEIVSPVVQGSARSRLQRRNDIVNKNTVLPVVIHGDAAFIGQGVVMETFNFSQARGFNTGGSIHIVVNNQVGFTTSNHDDARSSIYCTDIAKMIDAPILHVNGDEPESCIFAIKLAFEFRMQFKRDIVIDIFCYRRQGHNEADEPSLTQPLMYKKIKALPVLRELYASRLISENCVASQEVDKNINDYRDKLDRGDLIVARSATDLPDGFSPDWRAHMQASPDEVVDTNISLETLKDLAVKLEFLPQDFKLHPVIKKTLGDREQMSQGNMPLNWGYAETMAYASILQDGHEVRLCGQDAGRGTFSHRHAVLHDQNTADVYIPLANIAKEPNKSFTVVDSVLSEVSVLGFEYGYSASSPQSLVLWEAQFGDFSNCAQVVIDQFISSAEQKWGRVSGLVMLLPHGHEGQGPEHTSARLERYLQLCAQNNMQVCVPTTPAQMFHLLRRQIKRAVRKPLVVMTPKSLLRHKLAVSSIADLTSSKFFEVLPDVENLDKSFLEKVILCSGKVYYDLLQKRIDAKITNTAIIRIEQLYPFPKQDIIKILQSYNNAKKIVWCQEEPENQGAWYIIYYKLGQCLDDKQTLFYAGRDEAASPAVGNPQVHMQAQIALVQHAFDL